MAKFLEMKDYAVPNTNILVLPEREVCKKKRKKETRPTWDKNLPLSIFCNNLNGKRI